MMSLRDSYWFDLPAKMRRRIRAIREARRALEKWNSTRPRTKPCEVKVICPESLDTYRFTLYRPA